MKREFVATHSEDFLLPVPGTAESRKNRSFTVAPEASLFISLVSWCSVTV